MKSSDVTDEMLRELAKVLPQRFYVWNVVDEKLILAACANVALRSAIDAAVLAERQACADIADQWRATDDAISADDAVIEVRNQILAR